MNDQISMQDLESSLNVMIRSEIPHMKLISDEKLSALKEWTRILAKVSFLSVKFNLIQFFFWFKKKFRFKVMKFFFIKEVTVKKNINPL